MSHNEWQQEFEATDIEELRRRVQGNVYAPEKLTKARRFLYEHDTRYPRRADIKSTIALVISGIALATFRRKICLS